MCVCVCVCVWGGGVCVTHVVKWWIDLEVQGFTILKEAVDTLLKESVCAWKNSSRDLSKTVGFVVNQTFRLHSGFYRVIKLITPLNCVITPALWNNLTHFVYTAWTKCFWQANSVLVEWNTFVTLCWWEWLGSHTVTLQRLLRFSMFSFSSSPHWELMLPLLYLRLIHTVIVYQCWSLDT